MHDVHNETNTLARAVVVVLMKLILRLKNNNSSFYNEERKGDNDEELCYNIHNRHLLLRILLTVMPTAIIFLFRYILASLSLQYYRIH